MEMIKFKHGYRSLKEKYYEQFPYLGGAGNFGMSDMVDKSDFSEGDDDVVPINPIKEKDNQIVELKRALEGSKKEISDVNAVKERLNKARSELLSANKSTILAKNKLEFARKVTEQRMSNCLNQASEDLEEELVTLYSTLVDEEQFKLEDDVISPSEDFLKQVEEKVMERGELPSEKLKLSKVKNKILEKVKTRKMDRERSRERRDSFSSVRSTSSKRTSGDMAGGEHKSRKTDESAIPLPIKA